MDILARFLQLLRWVEGLSDLLEYLTTPIGAIAIFTLALYGCFLTLTEEATMAMTLAGSVALVLACIVTKPDF
ncbi:hypothetical protein C7271_14105 [filamentous cyanobacterium CCP5]|nr:hypothetical protein C7271_14105 [filamentous cyanobacterium CCP5]